MSLTRVLPADTTAARAARRFVEQQVTDARLRQDGIVVASELVANALRYGDPPITISIDLEQETVASPVLRISVSSRRRPDQPSWPRLIGGDRAGSGTRADSDDARAPDQEGGRGLRLVALLADAWDWQADGVQTTVWAVLRGCREAQPTDT
ncbi:MAG: ATP-binding protein [Actinomycetales bacterium]|nr:ATP-binding protein [Actinomycetales bacterium]